MGFLTWSGLFNYLKPADASHPLEISKSVAGIPVKRPIFFAGAKGFCVKSLVEYLSNPAVPVGLCLSMQSQVGLGLLTGFGGFIYHSFKP